jgi:hypothetical protein
MKKKSLSIIILTILVFSCKKDGPVYLRNDCSIKRTDYTVTGTIQSWVIAYYKDNQIVHLETSDGRLEDRKYDNRGNLIEWDLNTDEKITWEYNSWNKITKATYFTNNHLDKSYVSMFKDTLEISGFSLDDKNDTIGHWKYYYNLNNKPDSFINNSVHRYYYYSLEIDSVITTDMDRHLLGQQYYKYNNGNKVYDELREYSPYGHIDWQVIYTWEYNNKNLVIRHTSEIPSYDQMVDYRSYYNESDEIVKLEAFDKSNTLISYTNSIYENSKLIRTESFNGLNELTGYDVYENTCRK